MLPLELNLYILSYLSVKELCQLCVLSKYFRALSEDDFLWRQRLSRDFFQETSESNLKLLYRNNVSTAGSVVKNLQKWLRLYPDTQYTNYKAIDLYEEYQKSIRQILANSITRDTYSIDPEAYDTDEDETQAVQPILVTSLPKFDARVIAHRIVTLLNGSENKINSKGKLNQTLLHAFAVIGEIEALKIFIDAGGIFDLRDKAGHSPLAFLINYYMENLVTMSAKQASAFNQFFKEYVLTKPLKLTLEDIMVDKPGEATDFIHVLVAYGLHQGSIEEHQLNEFYAWFRSNLGQSCDKTLIEDYKREIASLSLTPGPH